MYGGEADLSRGSGGPEAPQRMEAKPTNGAERLQKKEKKRNLLYLVCDEMGPCLISMMYSTVKYCRILRSVQFCTVLYSTE